jgi:hypothetical protein
MPSHEHSAADALLPNYRDLSACGAALCGSSQFPRVGALYLTSEFARPSLRSQIATSTLVDRGLPSMRTGER